MKKLISILFIVFAIVMISCGHGYTADIGVRITTKVPAHGHSGPLDGGILRPAQTLVSNSTRTTLPIGIGETIILPWDTEYWDTLNTHSTTTNSTRFTMPVGYNTYKLFCNIVSGATPSGYGITVRKNGQATSSNAGIFINEVFGVGLLTTTSEKLMSPVLDASPGDYLELYAQNLNAGWGPSILESNFGTYCSIEIFR